MSRRAVFLDRDGVINRAVIRNGKPYPPAGPEEIEILPGVREALDQLKAAGFVLVVVSNQPDVARGKTDHETVEAINTRLAERLPLDDFRVCYHDGSDGCDCRKPKPGMLLAAARDHGIGLSESFMVGDRWRDVGAGQMAGCKTLFIDCGYDERQPDRCDYRVKSLAEAAQIILSSAGG
jgi:D-glycero-D-manno-heptose 1,7-bisphosphate phosphatase